MKTKAKVIILAIASIITACTPSSFMTSTPKIENTAVVSTPTSTTDTEFPLLNTTMGDFIIVSARLVDEARDTKAPPGDKFLLVELARPGMEKLVMGEFSVESFQSMVTDNRSEIYILRDDGSQLFYSGMGGWLNEDEFVMGFTVFQPLPKTYTLYWKGNSPIDLNIEEEL